MSETTSNYYLFFDKAKIVAARTEVNTTYMVDL